MSRRVYIIIYIIYNVNNIPVFILIVYNNQGGESLSVAKIIHFYWMQISVAKLPKYGHITVLQLSHSILDSLQTLLFLLVSLTQILQSFKAPRSCSASQM